MKVFITRSIPSIAEELLKKEKIDIEVYPEDNPIPYNLLKRKVKDSDALISLLTDKIDSELIDQMKNCRVIANYAVGYNNIDVTYANFKNIIVTNTPDVLTDSTADLTMALVLAASRNLFSAEKFLRDGKYESWSPKLFRGVELKNKIFGIIGAGRIGTTVAKRAYSFGCKIIYVSRSENSELNNLTGADKVSLTEALSVSDFISVHLPLNPETHYLLNSSNLKLMKKSAILINTSRGEIVEEKGLISLLKNKKLFAVGLDVFENEPNVNPELLSFENVIVLPHIGSATFEARDRMAEIAAQNVVAVLKGNKPVSPVN